MRAAIASALHRLAEAIDRSEPSRPPGSEQHPSGRPALPEPPTWRPHLAVVPTGYAQGRADLQLNHRGHGASEGDPTL